MGRVGKLLSFIRVTLANGAKISDVKFNPGGGDNLTGRHAADPGDDSHPLPGDWPVSVSMPGTGRRDIVAYADTVNDPKAQPGDKRIYARKTADGLNICEVWLKNDGTISITNETVSLEVLNDGTVTLDNGNATVEIVPAGDITVTNTTKVTIDSPDVEMTGNLLVNGNIDSDQNITAVGDVSDTTDTMQGMRDIYNGHTHLGNLGNPTGAPQQPM